MGIKSSQLINFRRIELNNWMIEFPSVAVAFLDTLICG